MERKIDIKKGLKEKQMAVEIDKYKDMLELKGNDQEAKKLSTYLSYALFKPFFVLKTNVFDYR